MGINKVYISPAPYIKEGKTINSIMIDMIIAFIPTIIAGIYFYGQNAIIVLSVAVISTVAWEMLWNKFVKKSKLLVDLSPIVTGITIGLIMPIHLPGWVIVIGTAFAIIFVKMFFGGLGQNIMNIGAATKAFLIASYASVMSAPIVQDSTTAASGEVVEKTIPLIEQLLGQAYGNIGEVSILAIVIGGFYLAFRGVINLRGPITFIVFSFAVHNILGETGLISGAFFFAAFFMITDYGTTPITKYGQYIFAAAAGVVASFITIKGYNLEGPYYAIIILNLFTPMIEFYTTRRIKVKEDA